MENEEKIQKMNLEILDLIEKWQTQLPVYEITHAFIVNATSACLFCAPNGELHGVRTILASVESGIVQYEETHS